MRVTSPDEQRYVMPRLLGGLGNQLFQVVTAHAYARRTGRILRLPRRIREGGRRRIYHQSLFDRLPMIGRFEQMRRRSVHTEPLFSYSPIPDHEASDFELSGYFQSARYFQPSDVEAVLCPAEALVLRAEDVLAGLRARAQGAPLVAVHVRRGDYLYKADYHPVLDASYYCHALARFEGPVAIALFSDDLSTCLRESPFAQRSVMPVDESDEVSLLVMAGCDHHIIANSSFSWWGAYLASSRAGRVFAPRPWFGPLGPKDTQDLLPTAWEVVTWR